MTDFQKVSADIKGNVLAAEAKLKSPQINSVIVQALIILAGLCKSMEAVMKKIFQTVPQVFYCRIAEKQLMYLNNSYHYCKYFLVETKTVLCCSLQKVNQQSLAMSQSMCSTLHTHVLNTYLSAQVR